MDSRRMLIAALLVVSITACEASQSTDNQSDGASPSATSSTGAQSDAQVGEAGATASSAIRVLEGKLKKQMPYARLREIVLAEGWAPVVDPACKENVGGQALICDQLPELESCSGDGYCLMWFAHSAARNKLRVGTYGDYARWNIPGQESALAVRFWESKDDGALAALKMGNAAACPSRSFDAFLKAYASDPGVRDVFTSPSVKVMELVSEGDSMQTRLVDVRKSDYRGFNLAYERGEFHVIDGAGEVDPAASKVDVKPEAGGNYFVSYRYGMSEGNSYRFRGLNGCWYLAEDPEPPSP
jgi:hypothetical protein